MPQIQIDCSKFDCSKIRRLIENPTECADYLRKRGVDPNSEKANDFVDDLARIYLKCCWTPGAWPLGGLSPGGGAGPGLGGGAVLAGGLVLGLPGGGTITVGGGSGGAAGAAGAEAALARLIALLRLIPVWGWLIAAYLALWAADRATCIDHLVNCLGSPRKSHKRCVDCVLRCNRVGSWPHEWCHG